MAEDQRRSQVLKCRDDHRPVRFSSGIDCHDSAARFRLDDGSDCSWVGGDQCFGPETLRPRIEPWLTALFQSEHLSVLVGSGLTHALHDMATGKSLPGMSLREISTLNEAVAKEVARSAETSGRGRQGNVEDQIRAMGELLRGLEIVAAVTPDNSEEREQARAIREEAAEILQNFVDSILAGERGIIDAEEERRERREKRGDKED